MDFSKYPDSGVYYGGSERKKGILIGETPYMLKFRKRTSFGLKNNHISEYIGSHIFAYLGFEVQETHLGMYKGEEVVACKDFNVQGRMFVPFNDVGESTLDTDKERYSYDYSDIMDMLRLNAKLANVGTTVENFWKMYIVDALIGNFDRHGCNWGFIKENNRYSMAPVFDNGSCLFPALTDEEEMLHIINSTSETEKRIFTFPTSQIKLNGRKSSYYEVIHSLEFPECNKALEDIYARIKIEKLLCIIDATPMISMVQKKFYKHMLIERYEKILKSSYNILKEGETDEGNGNKGNHMSQ